MQPVRFVLGWATWWMYVITAMQAVLGLGYMVLQVYRYRGLLRG